MRSVQLFEAGQAIAAGYRRRLRERCDEGTVDAMGYPIAAATAEALYVSGERPKQFGVPSRLKHMSEES